MSARPVQRERDPRWVAAITKKLAQHISGLDDHCFRFDSQFISRATRIHPVRAKELIHELVDRFWFGQRRGSVIKVKVFFHSVALTFFAELSISLVSVCLVRAVLTL